MSEYTIVKSKYNDGACIKKSLKELGYVFEEHSIGQRLYGYTGDLRKQTAHIIVRRRYVGSAANDVGFCKQANGNYNLIISDYDRRSNSKSEQDFMHKLVQLYTKHKLLKQFKSMGKMVTSVKTKDGRIKIRARG